MNENDRYRDAINESPTRDEFGDMLGLQMNIALKEIVTIIIDKKVPDLPVRAVSSEYIDLYNKLIRLCTNRHEKIHDPMWDTSKHSTILKIAELFRFLLKPI